MFAKYGWQYSRSPPPIAGACAAVGLLLALYQERGSLFRARELAQSSLKETEIDLIVEQERTRIARDLHDVLAHSLAVIAAQADGTRYLSKDQPKAVLNALDTIARSARSALVDAQRVIEGVRDDGMVTPQPRLSDIPALIEGMQRGSLKIHRSESGTPVELSNGQEMAVFRIVQECLTNALKHGGRGTDVRLHLDWSGPGLTLHAASAVAAVSQGDAGDPAPARVGRGLPGMRERAHLAGGWLTAGPDGEHFRVTVFIPYSTRGSSSDDDTAGARAGDAFAEIADAEGHPALVASGLQSVTALEADHRG
jgi:signal transduction histidine kinase